MFYFYIQTHRGRQQIIIANKSSYMHIVNNYTEVAACDASVGAHIIHKQTLLYFISYNYGSILY